MTDAVIDTETTGLPDYGPVRLVSIAVVALESGAPLLHTLIQPRVPGEDCYLIPTEATEIHGITDADVADAPGWGDVRECLKRILEGRRVLWAYNVDFEIRVIRDHDRVWCRATGGEPLRLFQTHRHQGIVRAGCAMEWFADPWGVGSRAKWVGLGAAAGEAGHDWSGAYAHTALGDALACRSVVMHLKRQIRQGLPCRLCGQTGSLRSGGGLAYCTECYKVLCPMVDAIAEIAGAARGMPSKAACRDARAMMDERLDRMGLTVPGSWYDEAWEIWRDEMW